MIGYVLLGGASLLSLLGFGILAMVLLLVAVIQAGRATDDSGVDALSLTHARFVRKTAGMALLAHLAITVFLVAEMVLAIRGGQAGGMVQAFLIHYIIDHASEFIIGAWTAYRAIKGGLNLGDQKQPCGSAPALTRDHQDAPAPAQIVGGVVD